MKLGIDVFLHDHKNILRNRNFVLITGSSNVDSTNIPVYQSVKKIAGNRLKAIWSLQHGFFVDKQDNMIYSDSFYWKDFDIEIKSLYRECIYPSPEWLIDVDALLIDIFDIGTRVYTFVNHVLLLLKSISGKKIDIIILDRPNPINGMDCEGNLMKEEYFSIVGQIPVPMRHGLTTGEFINLGRHYHEIDLDLEIVKAKSWQRHQLYDGCWTYPSPNMPSLQTALIYPGAVMLEGTNLSEGRGTTRPFELVGAPFIDHFRMIEKLKQLNIQNLDYIPVFFKPEFSKFKGEVCKGILLQANKGSSLKSFQVFYEIIRWVKHSYPQEFKWKQPPYEFEYERLPIDMICGSDFIRKTIEKNQSYKEISLKIETEIQKYKEVTVDYLLYPPE